MEDTESKAEKSADTAESSQNEPPLEDRLILTTMDRIRKTVYSQPEWEAYLLEKLEKQEKAQGKSVGSKNIGFIQRLKNVFKTSQESRFFLETETEEFLNTEKKKVQEHQD